MSCLLDTESAQADLDQIWLFIARDNPGAADQFLNRLIKRC
jgi:plasmid stabilization system protein ParE